MNTVGHQEEALAEQSAEEAPSAVESPPIRKAEEEEHASAVTEKRENPQNTFRSTRVPAGQELSDDVIELRAYKKEYPGIFSTDEARKEEAMWHAVLEGMKEALQSTEAYLKAHNPALASEFELEPILQGEESEQGGGGTKRGESFDSFRLRRKVIPFLTKDGTLEFVWSGLLFLNFVDDKHRELGGLTQHRNEASVKTLSSELGHLKMLVDPISSARLKELNEKGGVMQQERDGVSDFSSSTQQGEGANEAGGSALNPEERRMEKEEEAKEGKKDEEDEEEEEEAASSSQPALPSGEEAPAMLSTSMEALARRITDLEDAVKADKERRQGLEGLVEKEFKRLEELEAEVKGDTKGGEAKGSSPAVLGKRRKVEAEGGGGGGEEAMAEGEELDVEDEMRNLTGDVAELKRSKKDVDDKIKDLDAKVVDVTQHVDEIDSILVKVSGL